MIIGHKKITQYFSSAMAEKTLSHAYCFFGSSEVGKRTVAFYIAAKLLNTTEEKLKSNPDFFYVERGEDEKTGKLKKEITVAQARELRSNLQRTGWNIGYRVVVINEAELLNSESGNALLKILEEPPKGSVFFLLSENESALLPTIKSRVQSFHFSLVKASEIEAGLIARGVDEEKAKVFARRSLGKPGRAIRFLEEDFVEQYEKNKEKFQNLIGAPFYKKIQLVEELFGDKEDGERGRQEWQKILDLWVAWFRDILLKKQGGLLHAGEPGLLVKANFSNGELLQIIDSLTRLKTLMRQNIHPRLAVEEALINF